MNDPPTTSKSSHLLDGHYSISDLIDMDRLRPVFERFCQFTGYGLAFMTYPDEELLAVTGWREVCFAFHRANPASAGICFKSNSALIAKASKPGARVIEPCGHGLIDGAVPVILNGKCLAVLVTGQTFFHPPDMEHFKRQAQRFGYDPDKYLAAIRQVPVVSEAQFGIILSFLGDLAEFIAYLGYHALALRAKVETLTKEIAERKRAEEEAQEYQQRLRRLALQLTRAEDRERKRLASNIHDDLGQVLSAVMMQLSVLRQPGDPVNRAGEMEVIEDLVKRAVESTRSLTRSLSYPALDDLGLPACTELLAEDIDKLYGLKVKVLGVKTPIAIELRALLFRSIRELLVNVAKHAKVPAATVRFSRRGQATRVMVNDHGKGFALASLGSDSKQAGFGLFSIRERLHDLGGRVAIRSAPGKGATVMLTVPDAVFKKELPGAA